MFTRYLYIKIRENKITVRDVKTGKEVTGVADESFSTDRLLVGDFRHAEQLVKRLANEIASGFCYKKILIQPLGKIEGALSWLFAS